MGRILSVGVAVGNPSPSAKGLQGPPGGEFWKEGLATSQTFGLLRDAFPFCSPQGQSLPFQREVWRDCLCWERPKADPSPSAKGLQGLLGGGFWKEGLATTQAFGLLRDAFPFCSPQGPLQTSTKNCLAPKEPIFFVFIAPSKQAWVATNTKKGFDIHRSQAILCAFAEGEGFEPPDP